MTDYQKMTVALKPDTHRAFKAACAKNGTTISREISRFVKIRTQELNGDVDLPSPELIARSFSAIREIRDRLNSEVERIAAYEERAREDISPD